jgi:hypothetical protein
VSRLGSYRYNKLNVLSITCNHIHTLTFCCGWASQRHQSMLLAADTSTSSSSFCGPRISVIFNIRLIQEYRLFSKRCCCQGVFVLRTPSPSTDLWDHVPQHHTSSPYDYNCSKIKSGYPFCYDACDMCTKRRSTSLIEAAIDKAGESNLLLGSASSTSNVLATAG